MTASQLVPSTQLFCHGWPILFLKTGITDPDDPSAVKFAIIQWESAEEIDINRTQFDSAKILEMISNGSAAANRTWPHETPQWWTHPYKPPRPVEPKGLCHLYNTTIGAQVYLPSRQICISYRHYMHLHKGPKLEQ